MEDDETKEEGRMDARKSRAKYRNQNQRLYTVFEPHHWHGKPVTE